MSGRTARTWGWILVGAAVLGAGLVVVFVTGMEEPCNTEDRLPGICSTGDGSGAFSQPEDGSGFRDESTDATLGVLGLLLLVVGGGGAPFAFRKARRLRQAGVVAHPFGSAHPPGAMAQPVLAVHPVGAPAVPTATTSSGAVVTLGVASAAGRPICVLLGETGLVTSARDGTCQPAFWCMSDGRVHVSVPGSAELTPVAPSVPVVEAHVLLRQWAPAQELPSQRSEA